MDARICRLVVQFQKRAFWRGLFATLIENLTFEVLIFFTFRAHVDLRAPFHVRIRCAHDRKSLFARVVSLRGVGGVNVCHKNASWRRSWSREKLESLRYKDLALLLAESECSCLEGRQLEDESIALQKTQFDLAIERVVGGRRAVYTLIFF